MSRSHFGNLPRLTSRAAETRGQIMMNRKVLPTQNGVTYIRKGKVNP